MKYDTHIGSCQVYLQIIYKFPTLAPHDRNSPPKLTYSICQIMRSAVDSEQSAARQFDPAGFFGYGWYV